MSTLVKEFQGTAIHLTPEGKFQARVGTRTITRMTCRALEKELAKLAQPVKGFALNTYNYRVFPVLVISVEHRRYRDYYKTTEGESHEGTPYLWDDELVAKLTDYGKRRTESIIAFEKEFNALMELARPIDNDMIEAERK